MKAIVRIESPTAGTPERVVGLVEDAATGTTDCGAMFGGVDADYNLISVPGGEETDARAARLTRSDYDFGTTTFTWIPYSERYNYIDISTVSSPGSDGVYEITADGVAKITIDVQKKKGSDDTNMTAAGDNEELMIKCSQPLDFSTTIKPSLTNGAVSFDVLSDRAVARVELCVGPADETLILSHSNVYILRFV